MRLRGGAHTTLNSNRPSPSTTDVVDATMWSVAELLANPKWIRGVVDGVVIVDSRDVLGVWDHRHYPSWYFPVRDVTVDLRPTGEVRTTANVGSATVRNPRSGSGQLPASFGPGWV